MIYPTMSQLLQGILIAIFLTSIAIDSVKANQLTCPSHSAPCSSSDYDYCQNGGLCCEQAETGHRICICTEEYTGKYCHRRRFRAPRDID